MTDRFISGVIRSINVTVGLATTTQTCRRAQRIHQTSRIVSIAAGRLITSAVLAAFSQNRRDPISVQIVGDGPLGSMFADVTERGDIRTMVKNPSATVAPGLLTATRADSLAGAFGAGVMSVIRQPADAPFARSTTPLVGGEVDDDVRHYLAASDQVRTALRTLVVLDSEHHVSIAGGTVLQAMPDANELAMDALSHRLDEAFLHGKPPTDLDQLSDLLGEPIEIPSDPVSLAWQCRCSYERVLSGIRLLGPIDLADMVQKQETAQVRCDFCGQQYEVPPGDVRQVYEQTIAGRN